MKSIADTLFDLYRGTPQHEEWVVACLTGAWPALVGDRLARVCRPSRFERNCLTIEITDPAWSGALRSMETELTEKFRASTRLEIRGIRFRQTAE